MKCSFLIALAVSWSVVGCALSGYGSEESVLFVPTNAESSEPINTFVPYENLELSVEFECPGKMHSVMISPVVPLPPVVPVGFLNESGSNVKILLPTKDLSPIEAIRLLTKEGIAIDLNSHDMFRGSVAKGFGTLVTLHLKTDCRKLDKGSIEIREFQIDGKAYAPIKAGLIFKSTSKIGMGYLQA